MSRVAFLLLLLLAPAGACAQTTPGGAPDIVVEPDGRIDDVRLMADIRTLAADSMEGRQAGTAGGERARRYLLARFRELGLRSFDGGYEQEFRLAGAPAGTAPGVNLVGYIRGSEFPDRYIVVSAHYDHLGVQNGRIFNGADDNASGTAGLLALAGHFRLHAPRHSILFVATDAEEGSVHGGHGLQGARAFVADPPVPIGSIVLNVNLDMISRSDRDELYVAGTHPYPALSPLVDRVAAGAPLRLRKGHDRPELPPGQDWTMSSDHGAFHEARIPFLYFGVEDHADYHRETDVVENIEPGFYVRAVATVLDALLAADGSLAGQRPVDDVARTSSSSSRAPSRAVRPSGS